MIKQCKTCGADFGPKRYPEGQLEAKSRFAARAYCSPKCGRDAGAITRRERAAQGLYVRSMADAKARGSAVAGLRIHVQARAEHNPPTRVRLSFLERTIPISDWERERVGS